MDNRDSPSAREMEPSVLTSDGLILWHLSATSQADLWCLVFEFSDGFYLVLDDNPDGTDPPRLNERQKDIHSLIHRAEELRGSLLRCGWTEHDVE
jgi:hypothetical protein